MSSTSLESVALNSTNVWRSHYMADAVTWNDSLADYAEDWAKGCIWKHSSGPHGENLAAGFENATLAIDAWGKEEKDYSYSKGAFGEKTGHFTQLVWRNTTSIGCAEIDCQNDASNGVKGKFLVCEYGPPGNVRDQFKYNVLKPGMDGNGTPGFGSAATSAKSNTRLSVMTLGVAWIVLALVGDVW